MAIDFGPLVEDVEDLSQVPLGAVRPAGCSRVRLYSFEQSTQLVREVLHTPNGVVKFVFSDADREAPLLFIGGRVLSELQRGRVIDAGIQSGPEVVEHLSKLERERQEPITLDCAEEKLPIPVVVYLGTGTVHLVCIKSVPYLYEGLAMKLSPINTIPARIEW